MGWLVTSISGHDNLVFLSDLNVREADELFQRLTIGTDLGDEFEVCECGYNGEGGVLGGGLGVRVHTYPRLGGTVVGAHERQVTYYIDTTKKT